MTRVLIIGGGVAGPVTAMALQRAGIGAVVYEAHPTTSGEEVGSYLTVATNGIDALRAIGADTPVLHAGLPTPPTCRAGSTRLPAFPGDPGAQRGSRGRQAHRAGQ